MFWKKRNNAAKIIRAKIATISQEPELGMLTLQTEQGPIRLLIDKERAHDLMEECLALIGYPVEER